MRNKKLLLALIFLIFITGGYIFERYRISNSVAIRVGTVHHRIDYDLMCSINYISYLLEKEGYYIDGVSYAGNLYPKSLDSAKINLFVRGFEPFYDLRINYNKKNIFYVERLVHQHIEEFSGYDVYLTTQNRIRQNGQEYVMQMMPSGAIPHPLLKPNYQYDVLYIYELENIDYVRFLKNNIQKYKIYAGNQFAMLDEKVRQQELAKARLVVYEMEPNGLDDEDYVSFAVYDIMSYGRPCLTNYKLPLAQKFASKIAMFDNQQRLIDMTKSILQLPVQELEQKAQQARDILRAEEYPQLKNLLNKKY